MDWSCKNVLGLRESLRFVYTMSSIKEYQKPSKHMKNRVQCKHVGKEHTAWLFQPLALEAADIFVAEDSGVVYCEMGNLLHRDDIAYWWVYPGNLVQWVGLGLEACETVKTMPASSSALVFTAETLHQAYSAAAAHTTSADQLLEKIAQGELFVCSWCIRPGTCAWAFEVTKVALS